MKGLAILLAVVALAAAQTQASQEQADLDRELAAAGGNPVEYLRAIEKHLREYPDSPRRAELERAALRAAIEADDDPPIILYGERVLGRQTGDLTMLERVTRALLGSDSAGNAQAAWKYAQRYEQLARQMQEGGPSPAGAAARREQADRDLGLALRYQARATGNLGRARDALALAQRSFETYPNADAAREIARWYERLGQPEPAARALADAFTIPDPHNTDAARAHDRALMGELWRRAKGSEAGLGDLILQAYDRNVALVHLNPPPANPMALTLGGVDGRKLPLVSLKGKVAVLDFWATWCVPCREQHLLYDEVKRRFAKDEGVVFLSIDTDDDPSLVKPFLEEMHWPDKPYFEGGLSAALRIVSIPTTIVLDPHGAVFGRLEGFVPESFVETLSERIREAEGTERR
jgi:thiol-disulfide isomerase/thioredoxin